PDARDLLVDEPAGQAVPLDPDDLAHLARFLVADLDLARDLVLNHGLADALECPGAEVLGGSGAVEGADEGKGLADGILPGGGPAILEVVVPDEAPVAEDQLVDAQRLVVFPDGEAPTLGQPLRDQPVVLLLSLGRAVRATVDVLAVEDDDGALGVFAELWDVRGVGHGAASFRQSGTSTAFFPALGRTLDRREVSLTCYRRRV